MDRREFIRRTSLVVIFGSIGALAFLEAIGKLTSPAQATVIQTIGGGAGNQTQALTGPQTQTQLQTQTGSQTQTSQTQSQTPAGYVYVAPLSALGGKSSAYFKHPTGGTSILIDYGAQWRAFSAICTHAGCVVDFTGSSLYCPCHAGYFDPTNGAVQGGPPPSPLAEYGVVIQNGDIYVSKNVIN